jgi:hypothetical protein
MLVFHHLIGEVADLFTEIVFCGGENALILIAGVRGYDQPNTGRGDDADRASTAIERFLGRGDLVGPLMRGC